MNELLLDGEQISAGRGCLYPGHIRHALRLMTTQVEPLLQPATSMSR